MESLQGVRGDATYGLTREELAELSAEVDLLIVGSRGYGPLRRVILGSTSINLQARARGPLLILPRGTRYAAPSSPAAEGAQAGDRGLILAPFSAPGLDAATAEGGTVSSMAADAEKGGEGGQVVRIVLADDHQVVRSGLRLLLENEHGLEVVAEASDVDSARRYVRGHHPDVLVLDLNMPGGSSLEAIPQIREESPETQIVVLTMQQEPAFAREALGAGALGYVLKEAADDELVEAVRNAAAGESYLNPRLGARIASEPPPGPPDDLSEREVEVLRLIALGHTNAEIAEQLFLSVRTVETHRSHIQQKLRLSTRAELVRYALERGLIDAGG